MEFHVLGPLRVHEGGGEVEIRRGISRTLLIALLLRARETVAASSLMELLWGDDQPRNPANALQIQISYLRKTLSSGSASAAQPIVTRPGGYALDIEPDAVDAVRFERLLADASLATPVGSDDAMVDDQLLAIEEALALWRGDALSDVAGESFALGTATRLEEMRWSAHEQRIDLLLTLGRHREAVGELGTLVSEQPLRERFHEQLVLALYRCGRQADALRAFDSARSTLVDELGLDPGPALQALERNVLSQDPSLDLQPRTPAAVLVEPTPTVPAEWRRNYVPAPLTALIGRDTEVSRVRDLLTRSRLVTLTGPGGAGKTRLAIDISAREAAHGKVRYVDLSSIDLPELVASTVASALGATTGLNEDAGDVAASALAAETGLLVLDTCEHVLAGASNLASTVLRRAPGMRVLATSRRPLAVAGEAAWPVPPLGVAPLDAESTEAIRASPAVTLFCERAQDVRPDFELSDDNAVDVAGICLALDGLPLAIELAAARADVLSPGAILDRLQNRFDLLIQGAVDVAARQQTLRGAIDWSVELLSEEQRCFFARLGAFAGGFDIDAADAVAGAGSQDSLTLLSSLVRHSMVTTDGDRFRLLDTLRAYAAELLGDLDADDTRRRHARHYTQVAERSESLVRGVGQGEALAGLRTEIPNFQAALEWSLSVGDLDIATRLAGSLAWFWALDGRLDVADRHLRRAIVIDSVPVETRAKVLWGYSLLVAGLGHLDEALETGEASTALARQSGDNAAIGCGLNAAAVAHWALGDLDAAAAAHDEAIELFVDAGDLWGESICRVLRARTAFDRGDADSENRLRVGLGVARRCGDAHVIGIALGLLAQLQANSGATTEPAIESARESLRLQESIGYTEGTIAALHLLARLHLASGDTADARDELLRSLRLAWKMQHAAAICETLEDLAQIASNDGDDQTAIELLSAAETERTARNLPVRPPDRPTIDKLQAHLGSSIMGDQPEVPAMSDVVVSLLR
ncbi:MAG: AfsR/SARP family transcriptional regulator [Iamia sp.]